jgi:hypothetical protein
VLKAQSTLLEDRTALHNAALEMQAKFPGTDYVTALKTASIGGADPNDPLGDSRQTAGYDPARLKVHDAALAYSRAHGVSYAAALAAINFCA